MKYFFLLITFQFSSFLLAFEVPNLELQSVQVENVAVDISDNSGVVGFDRAVLDMGVLKLNQEAKTLNVSTNEREVNALYLTSDIDLKRMNLNGMSLSWNQQIQLSIAYMQIQTSDEFIELYAGEANCQNISNNPPSDLDLYSLIFDFLEQCTDSSVISARELTPPKVIQAMFRDIVSKHNDLKGNNTELIKVEDFDFLSSSQRIETNFKLNWPIKLQYLFKATIAVDRATKTIQLSDLNLRQGFIGLTRLMLITLKAQNIPGIDVSISRKIVTIDLEKLLTES